MIYKIQWKEEVVSASMTSLFYAVSIAMVFILENIAPSGPCTPGAGMFWLISLPFISSALLVKNLWKALISKKPSLLSAALHLIAATAIFSYF
jgi:hypothetical protein